MVEITDNIYNVIIMSGRPAGISAALYASRSKFSTLILEKDRMGSQIVTIEEVLTEYKNYIK